MREAISGMCRGEMDEDGWEEEVVSNVSNGRRGKGELFSRLRKSEAGAAARLDALVVQRDRPH